MSRSSRKKNSSVNYSVDGAESDSEYLADPPTPTEVGEHVEYAFGAGGLSMIVEKILGRKMIPNSADPNVSDELFFIKWKKMSYLHASWERREDIERVDAGGKGKIKRFMLTPMPPSLKGEKVEKKSTGPNGEDEAGADAANALDDDEAAEDEDEVEYYNPEMAEVHRILSCDNANTSHSTAIHSHDLAPKDPAGEGTEGASAQAPLYDPENDVQYLVKWRGLPYSECTWERWEDIKFYYHEVWEFWQRQKPPNPKDYFAPHPSIQEYQKMTVSPRFGETEEGETELTLRDYQLEGVNWLLWNWWNGRSCILADEMGLGKTIQSTCFLQQLRNMPTTRVNGPFLIVAPLSLISQWQGEVETWAPKMNCIVYHGSAEARDVILQHEFYFQESFTPKAAVANLRKANVNKFHILLTTFEMIIKDIRILSKVDWKVLVVDEAHRLKNPTSQLFQQLHSIPHEHCVLLTGTPLQNKTEELWALLNFADRNRFASQYDFVAKFGDLKDASQVANLHNMLKPYLLRRVKEDVEKSLPPKEETIIEVALSSIQKQFYRAVYERNTSFLFKGAKASNQPSLMNVMMELRKCCNHPYLLRGAEERIVSDIEPEHRTDESFLFDKMIEASGKLQLLEKLLPRLFTEGHKVLIFSQMVRVLNILEDYVRHKGYLFERLDGNTRADKRNEAVTRFGNPALKRFVMLLSTKAGGLGLNLTAADTVIIFDSDWNPHNDIQAQARAHRIGQTKAVMVYRLLTRKTYEMHMFHQASMKLGMDRAVLAHARATEGEETASASEKGQGRYAISAKEIDELLKRGAYDVFREDDAEQQEFAEADIDAILTRRAHKVNYSSSGQTTGISSIGNFSKASFVSADQKEDIDINDPDFWRKAVGLAEVVQTDGDEVIMELPQQRKRKQTQMYTGHWGDEEFEELLTNKKTKKQEAKERKEREAKERQLRKDAQAEAKAKIVEIKMWGPHARDRVLRALSSFGFGRWQLVWRDSGGEVRDIRDIESFCRSYVYQAGLAAGEQEISKNDTDFVKDAIETARQMDALVKSGERTLDVPPSLQDDKFMSKLKSGNAKRSLARLDLLARVMMMIAAAADAAIKEKEKERGSSSSSGSSGSISAASATAISSDSPPDHDHDDPDTDNAPLIQVGQDLDGAVAQLTTDEITKYLPLGDIRPAWTVPQPWWDTECDCHLVIGTFRHGYGRYDQIRDDPTLIFIRKIDEAVAAAASGEGAAVEVDDDAAAVSGTTAGIATVEGSSSSAGEIGDVDSKYIAGSSVVGGDSARVSVAPPKGARDPDRDLGADVEEGGVEGGEGGGNDEDDEGGGGGGKGGKGEDTGEKDVTAMPDARVLSRLIQWLMFSKDALQTREQLRREAEEKQRARAADKAAGIVHRRKGSMGTAGSVGGEEEDEEEEEEFEGLSTLEKELELLAVMRLALSEEAMLPVYKANTQSIKRCETVVRAVQMATALATMNMSNNLSSSLPSSASPFASIATSSVSVSDASPLSPGSVPQQVAVEIDSNSTPMDVVNSSTGDAATTATEQVANKNVTVESVQEGSRERPQEGSPSLPVSAPTGTGTDGGEIFLSEEMLSESTIQRIVCALIVHGSPLSGFGDDEKLVSDCYDTDGGDGEQKCDIPSSVLHSIGIRSGSATTAEESSPEVSYVDVYSWEHFKRLCDVPLSTAELVVFYRQLWLPFCAEMLRKKWSFPQNAKRLIPNPFKKPMEHHSSNRCLVLIFTLRQQVLRTARYILSHEYDRFVKMLKSPVARELSGLPVWWCPWIHDVGLLLGCVKYGFLALEKIVSDPDLPFHRTHLETHIRRVFLYGCASVRPAALDELPDKDIAEKWVHLAVNQFADAKELENRLIILLGEMTCDFPWDHPYKMFSESFLADAPEIVAAVAAVQAASSSSGISDVVVGVGKRPAVSLTRFLNDTAKRRHLTLEERFVGSSAENVLVELAR